MTMHRIASVRSERHNSPRYAIGSALAFPVLLLLFLILGAWQSHAQVLYGSIVGAVTDPSGAVIVGADIAATQLSTNEVRIGKTNEAGIYSFTSVPSGAYRIAVRKSGFQEFQVKSVNVQFNAVTRVDARLEVGTAQQVVTVNAEAAQLQTDRADVNQVVASQELLDLPQPTRTYEGLLSTVPGVGVPVAGTLGTNNVDKSMSIEANGTSQSATDVRIEGVSAAQPWVPFRSSLTPSIEAIDSVSMVTGSADASQTLASGATVNVQLKSGTNQMHGEAYEFHNDNLWTARNYFQPAKTTPILPKNLENDFGGTVGGPILKNRLFYFVSYEDDYTSADAAHILTVPTPAMLTGDFTDLGSGTCATVNSAPACTPLYDPATGNADGTGRESFAAEYGNGNKIPASRISNNVKPLLALLAGFSPATTLPLASSTPYFDNLQLIFGAPTRLQKWDTKFDWVATQKLRVTGRYNFHPYNVLFPSSPAATLFNLVAPHTYGNTSATTLAATYIVTPKFLIDGSWGYTRSNEYEVPPDSNVKYGASTLGIPGVNLSALPIGGGIPQFNFTNYTDLGYNYPYLNYNDPIFSYAANATLTKGSNTIKFGFLLNQQHMNHVENAPDFFTFAGGATALNGGAKISQFNSFADFELGLPNGTESANFTPNTVGNSIQPFSSSKMDALQYSMYLTNTQQIGTKLTVTYGTSWSYYPVPTHGSYGLENLSGNYDPSHLSFYQYQVCGYGGIPKSCGIKTQKDLFGPQVGVAYRVLPSLVIRAGGSIATEQFNIGRDAIYNFPEQESYTALTTGYTPYGSLATGIPTFSTPNYKAGVIPLPTGASFYSLPQNIQRGYIESWNVSVEKELGPWMAQAAYVANASVKQHTRFDINYAPVLGAGTTSGALYSYNKTTSAEDAILPLGHTNYNSLQASVQRRLTNNYTIDAAYTWSKWLGLCCDTNGFGTLENSIPQDIRKNYVVMPGDRRYDLTITGTAESPFGKGKQWLQSGPAAYILGEWQLNASQIIVAGTPINVQEIAINPAFNTPGTVQTPNLVKSHVATNRGNLAEYFDTSAYQPINAPVLGTAPYDSVVGPGAANLDASLFRSFSYRERYKLQFRMEAFNVTNTPHFANPLPYAGIPGFGAITGTSAIGRLQDSRYFRFGMKILF